jgi:hypothetical protein
MVQMTYRLSYHSALLALIAGTWLAIASPASARAQSQPAEPVKRESASPDRDLAGTVNGIIVDTSGSFVSGAQVTLSREGQAAPLAAVSNEAGQFTFPNVVPGAFQLTVISNGFASKTYAGSVRAGEILDLPPIELAVASASSQVVVSLTPAEEAEAEVKDAEKQRVLGVLPNFYVTYNPAAVPLRPKQKFELAWKSSIDPVTFGVTAATAGIEQGTNAFSGYGQGAQGYAKRFGAAYADFVSATFLGSAILPSLLKQDPRYFYKGSGSVRSRVWYAIATAVICKGDNGHWQANYSGILGGLAAGGLSNLYYPASNRDGLTLTFENTAIGIGATAATNILQEFVIKKLTPHSPTYAPTQRP